MFLPFGVSIPSTTGLGPWHSLSPFSLSLCMPTDTSEEVADNLVATEAPAGEGEETVDAEGRAACSPICGSYDRTCRFLGRRV